MTDAYCERSGVTTRGDDPVDAVASRYLAAVLFRFKGATGNRVLLPTALAVACVEVLGVAGAGLSLVNAVRLPLAASSPEVSDAERLQTTLGEGPCLSAVATAEPLAAGEASMAARWPLYHHKLTHQTSFRSVVSLPLAPPGKRSFAALDLYSTGADPDRSLIEDPFRYDLADVITRFLAPAPLVHVWWTSEPVAAWLVAGSVEDRMNVWTAVGMIMAKTTMDQAGGLAVLRGHAFSHESTIDKTAQLVTTGQLPVDQIIG